ncbi:MAG TPA: hypothetical protein VGK41_01185 [Solirubrobacterales bacterium]
MTMMLLTSEDVGAPTLNGVNGALTALLRWALVQNGWAVEYGPTGNAAVFRAGSGNRHRLHVNHDNTVSGSAALALVRGCEDASSATALVDPFPTITQVANNLCNWYVSQTANSTARRWKILLHPTFFVLLIETNSNGEWDMNFFGDPGGIDPADTYACAISVRNTSNVGSTSYHWAYNLAAQVYPGGLSFANTKLWWCRDESGLVKSSKGSVGTMGSNYGFVTNAPAALGGYGNRLEREKVYLNCAADPSNSGNGLAVRAKRGWIPNVYSPVHSSYAAVQSEDTFGDSDYDPSAEFMFLRIYTTSYGNIIETTDTWSPPSG